MLHIGFDLPIINHCHALSQLLYPLSPFPRPLSSQLINLLFYSNNNKPNGGGIEIGQNTIYNIVLLIVDIVLLVFKFWLTIIQEIIQMFTTRPLEHVNGKLVLITGAGHGMGKEMALQYARLGAKVLCWDVNEQTNTQTVKEIKQAGGTAHGYICNVGRRDEVMELATKIQKEHGFVSIVINNAGIMPCHPLLEHTEQEIRLMYDVNVVAHFWVCLFSRSHTGYCLLAFVYIRFFSNSPSPSLHLADHPSLPARHDWAQRGQHCGSILLRWSLWPGQFGALLRHKVRRTWLHVSAGWGAAQEESTV